MESSSYAQQPQPPPQPYSMPPAGSLADPNEARYRQYAPAQYHGSPTHPPPNGQQYPYNPNVPQTLPPREVLPAQVPSSENGSAQGSAVTGPPPANLPEPASHSMVEMGRRYTLEVIQQPKRARMCGFGDKDRRPITPPPCIRLVITDIKTGTEIDINDIEFGYFVLNVDLWSADGTREVNLVRHSASSPSISAGLPTSYSQAQEFAAAYSNPLPIPSGPPSAGSTAPYPYYSHGPPANGQQPPAPYNPYPGQPQVNPYAQHQQPPPPPGAYGQGPPPPQYGQAPPQHQSGYPPRPSSPGYNPNRISAGYPNPNMDPGSMHRMAVMTGNGSPATGMYTRNLIGSLSASASRLTDPGDKIGIWFVLQDLSVRTEGTFRLRFSFANVGAPTTTPNGNPANQNSIVNTGRAPILASCFSEVFMVYSAKKFPGVVESTALSKCFATQGIKIPIRKDGPSKASNREEYDED